MVPCRYEFILLRSVEELEQNADAWNDLWMRSGTQSPLARAEILALWMRQFASTESFMALVITDSGRWSIAIPLWKERHLGMLGTGASPSNAWAAAGHILVESTVEEPALQYFARCLRHLALDWLWLDFVRPKHPDWQRFQRALQAATVPVYVHRRYDSAVLDISMDWHDFLARLSTEHRRKLRRNSEKLHAKHNCRFELYDNNFPGGLKDFVTALFEMESVGWKGTSGGVISRGMLGFFVDLAETLARVNAFRCYTLKADNELVAYQYGFLGKRVFYSLKIAYHPEYATFGPGQGLWYLILQDLCQSGEIDTFDCVGEFSEAQRFWRPRLEPTCEMMIPTSLSGRVALATYTAVASSVRYLRKRLTVSHKHPVN